MNLQDQIINLEIKISHQELTVNQLNDIIYRQQQQIDKLEDICKQLQQRIRSLNDNSQPSAEGYEIPPHY